MDEVVEEIKLKNNHVLRIYHDSNAESPRDWDNLGRMMCITRNYNLGDTDCGKITDKLECLQKIADDLEIDAVAHDLDMWEELYYDEERLQEWINLKNDWVCLSLYVYIHSGITISTAPFSCNWDSGQVGYIYCPTKKIEKEYGDTSKEILETVAKVLESEVKTYDQYLTGDVYGFRVFKITECDLGHEHEEEIDSCWGFYGNDWKTNGIIDHIDSELIPEEVEAVS